MLADDVSEATFVGEAAYYKIEEEKVENPGFVISENASTQGTSHEKSEAGGSGKA